MQSDVWVHDLNPYLVRFSDHLGIRWYGLSYLAGFLASALICYFLVRRQSKDPAPGIMAPHQVGNFVSACVFGTLIGGRLGYAVFYAPRLFLTTSAQPPYWEVLKIWSGGMSSHGGLLGVALAVLIFSRRQRLNWLGVGDLVVLGASVGIFFGRIANFINGELFGRLIPSDSLWPRALSVKFPGEMYLWLQHDRTLGLLGSPSLTSAAEAVGVSPLQWQSSIARLSNDASSESQIRLILQQLIQQIGSGNQQIRDLIAPQLSARYPSQLIEAVLEGPLLFFLAVWFWRKPRKPGEVAAFWLIAYAVVRIIGEQFRMPDAAIGFELWGLTRGQWLSVAMLVACMVFYLYAATRKQAEVRGWR